METWLLLGNILRFCLLWFSGKSPLKAFFVLSLPFQRQPRKGSEAQDEKVEVGLVFFWLPEFGPTNRGGARRDLR